MSTALSIILAVLAFGFLVMVHEFGHFAVAKLTGVQINEFAIGMGPKLFSFKPKKSETTYSLRLLPVGGFCAMEGEDEENDNPRAFTSKSVWVRLAILVAGSLMNLITGFIIIIIIFLPAKYTSEPVIESVADQYVETGLGGMLPGDKIVSINGERIYQTNDVAVFLERYYGKPYDIVLKRDGQKVVLDDVILEKKELTFDGEAFTGYGIRYLVTEATFLTNCRDSIFTGIDYVRLIRLSLTDLIFGKAQVKDLTGPIGITTMMTEVATDQNYAGFFNLVAFILINLSVMNLLPLPALDGGRIFFIFINCVVKLFRKKPIAYKYEGYIHLGGLALLLLLMVYVTFNDVIRLIN